MPDRAFIKLERVEKAYPTPAGDVCALKGIDLEVWEGEFVGIVGKSGAGKSTLVNMVAGIDKPTSGRVRVGTRAIHEMSEDQVARWRGRNVGVIFQFFQL
ncbi:MAG: ATP-binding cassette domain-containing protein, partial [Anaerolineae bacterium]|nr:ATP-binding cassette domain-containing protein [Anaerolineae bacterium]